jgi:CheY-like chemotaxis protein
MRQASTPMTVLLVDDEPDLRLVLRELLEIQGHRVAEAGNGVEALAFLAREPVTVVITDLAMPQMDGLELLRQIRNCGRPLPRSIAISGVMRANQPATRAAAELIGAHAILTKPFTNEELLRTLESVRTEIEAGWPASPVTPSSARLRRKAIASAAEGHAGGLVQSLTNDPAAAARALERDLAEGGDAEMIGALIEAAERLGKLRGVDLRISAAAVRTHLRRTGYAV